MSVNKKCRSNQYVASEEVCSEREIRPVCADLSEYLSSLSPLAEIKCSDFHMNLPCMELTLVAGNILELIHFPSSYRL